MEEEKITNENLENIYKIMKYEDHIFENYDTNDKIIPYIKSYIKEADIFDKIKINYDFKDAKNILKNLPGNYVAYRTFKDFNKVNEDYVIKKYEKSDVLKYKEAISEHIIKTSKYNFVKDELLERSIITDKDGKVYNYENFRYDTVNMMNYELESTGYVSNYNKNIKEYSCKELELFVKCYNEKINDSKLEYIERIIPNNKHRNVDKICTTLMYKN